MQLLKITRTPIKIEMEIEHSRIQANMQEPEVDISIKQNSLRVQAKNASVRVDSYQSRRSAGFAKAADVIKDGAERGVRAAQQATGQYGEIGSQLAQAYNGTSVADVSQNQMLEQAMAMPQLNFATKPAPDISWDPGSLMMQFIPSGITFDAKMLKNTMEYIPGELRINVEQYPSLTIEYLGEPIYVPASADPNT